MDKSTFPLEVGTPIVVFGKRANITEIFPNNRYEIEFENGSKDIISHNDIDTQKGREIDFDFLKELFLILRNEGYKATMSQLSHKIETLSDLEYSDLKEAYEEFDIERIVDIISGDIEGKVTISVMSIHNVAILIHNTLEDLGYISNIQEIEIKVKDINDDDYIKLSEAVGKLDADKIIEILKLQTKLNRNPSSKRLNVDFKLYRENKMPIWGREFYKEYDSVEETEEDLGISVKNCNQIWIGEDYHLLKESFECPDKELYINVYQDGSVTVDKGFIRKGSKMFNVKKIRRR